MNRSHATGHHRLFFAPRSMLYPILGIALVAVVVVTSRFPIEAHAQEPKQGGPIGSNYWGMKGPVNTPNDFWHLIVCTECHAKAQTRATKSEFRIVDAAKFWDLHQKAKGLAEVRPNAARYKDAKLQEQGRGPWHDYYQYVMTDHEWRKVIAEIAAKERKR